MAGVPFDTLKLARRFESAGFAPKQAGDMAEALAGEIGEIGVRVDLTSIEGFDLQWKIDSDLSLTPIVAIVAREGLE